MKASLAWRAALGAALLAHVVTTAPSTLAGPGGSLGASFARPDPFEPTPYQLALERVRHDSSPRARFIFFSSHRSTDRSEFFEASRRLVPRSVHWLSPRPRAWTLAWHESVPLERAALTRAVQTHDAEYLIFRGPPPDATRLPETARLLWSEDELSLFRMRRD